MMDLRVDVTMWSDDTVLGPMMPALELNAPTGEHHFGGRGTEQRKRDHARERELIPERRGGDGRKRSVAGQPVEKAALDESPLLSFAHFHEIGERQIVHL